MAEKKKDTKKAAAGTKYEAKTKRQVKDKAVQDIHTDKKQVDTVLKDLPKKMRDDVLKELRRRGGKLYPERGPKKK